MIWFLRLFSRYRELEAQIAEAASARISAEDDKRYWRSRAEIAESERDKVRASFEYSLKQIANFEAHRAGAPCVPFPDVFKTMPSPPEPVQPNTPTVPLRRNARELQQEAVQRSRQTAADRRAQLAMVNDDTGEADGTHR